MLAPALSGLLRGAQDVPPVPAAPATQGPAAGRAVAPSRAASLPELAEGQLEPAPSTIGFSDFLAALNPLQHLPVVGTIYRAATGTTIPAPLRVVGGFLLGGPIGAVASAVGAAAEEIFARSLGERPGAPGAPPATAVAAAEAPVPAGAQPAAAVPPPSGQAPSGAAPLATSTALASGGDGEERLRRLREATEAYARLGHAPMLAANRAPMAPALPGMR